MLDCIACKAKNKLSQIILDTFTSFYDFINCPAFVDIKQTLHYKVARVNIIRETFIFYELFLMFVLHFFTG